MDEPLARRTTLRVGGPADLYVEPASEADLAAVLQYCAESALRFFVLGRGSGRSQGRNHGRREELMLCACPIVS